MPEDRIKRKILLLGDGSVGKTSLIRRFVVDKFSDDYITTIGTKVTKKDVRLESASRPIDMTFMIWDVLGQKGYHSIQETAFQGAKGALLVYDVTRDETTRSLTSYWLPNLARVLGSTPFVLVGNKVDLVEDRTGAQDELRNLATGLGVRGLLSSAKTGENVETSFLHLARDILAQAGSKFSRDDGESGPGGLIVIADQIIADFCEHMGGQETAMPIVRQQLTRAGVDMRAPTSQGLRLAVDYLAEVESSFRDARDVEAAKVRRLNWIKEAT